MSRNLSHVAGWAPDSPRPAQLKEFFAQIESGRITSQVLQKFLRSGAYLSKKEQLARNIMGDDIIFPEEVAERCGLSYSEERLKEFNQTIPSVDDLRWCKEHNFALVAGPPELTSLLDARDLKPDNFYLQTGGWYAEAKEKFSRQDKAETKWLGVRKGSVPGSCSKTWQEQCRLISGDEYVPNAGEMGWFITVYYEVRKVRLFPDIYVRTSSLGSYGYRVSLGGFVSSGLDVYRWADGCRLDYLGLASARKFPKN